MEVHAFLCNTIYQLLAAECYALETMDSAKIKCDLFVDVDNTKQLIEYAESIKKLGIFQKIYYVKRIIGKHNKLVANSLKIESYLFPRRVFQKSIVEDPLPEIDYYNKVFISYLGPMARWFVFSFPKAEVSFFEDGLGSYESSVKYFYSTKKDRFFELLTGRGENTIRPSDLYLFCPEFYSGKLQNIIKRIPMPKKGDNKRYYLEDTFGVDESGIYSKYKYIYLGQPITSGDGAVQEIEEELLNVLREEYSEKALVRPHPRQDADMYYSLTIDSRGKSWEVACVDSILDSTVLIGFYSTAQFTPRLLYGKEPYLIFTFKMLDGVKSGIETDYAVETIRRLSKLYSSEKVFIPETIEEYKTILSAVM